MAQGGVAYDQLIGDQAYKYDWTDGAEHRLRRLRFESRAPATVARRSAARGLGQVRRLGERAIAAVARRGSSDARLGAWPERPVMRWRRAEAASFLISMWISSPGRSRS